MIDIELVDLTKEFVSPGETGLTDFQNKFHGMSQNRNSAFSHAVAVKG